MPRLRRCAVLLLCLAAGVFFSLTMEDRLRRRAFRAALPLAKIASVSGSLAADPRLLSGGRAVLTVQALEAANPGFRVSAHGRLTLIVSGFSDCDRFHRGVPVRVEAVRLRQDDKGVVGFTSGDSLRILSDCGFTGSVRAEGLALARFRLSTLGADTGPLLTALFLGWKEDPAAPEFVLFRKIGCSHLLALSGFHLVFFTGMLMVCLKPLIGRYGAAVLSLPIVAAYIWFVGPRPSLLRAGLLYAVGAYSFFAGRRVCFWTALPICVFALLLIDPVYLSDIGFQLSLGAFIGLRLAGGIQRLPGICRLPPLLRSSISASLGAQLATLPLVLHAFGVFQPFGALFALMMTPAVVLLMYLGALFLGASWAGFAFLLPLLRWCACRLYSLMMALARLGARIPMADTKTLLSPVFLIALFGIIVLSIGKRRLNELRFARCAFRAVSGKQSFDEEAIRSEFSDQP